MRRTSQTLSRRLTDLEGRRPGRTDLRIVRILREQSDPMPTDEAGVLHIVRTIIDPRPLCVH